VPASAELCSFCDYQRMEAECLTASGRHSLLRRLTAMVDKNLQGIALELVPAQFRGHFQRGLATKQFCPGFDGEICIFALAASGGRAQIHKSQAAACFFCDPEVDALGGRRQVAGLLKRLSPTAKAKALAERIPEDAPSRALGSGSGPAAAHAPATATEKKIYREQVLADRARGRKHAGRAPERAARGVEVCNSPPAPPAKRSARAAGLERWALRNTWPQCRACGQMLARDLTQKTLTRTQKVTAPASQCPRCRSTRALPGLKDVPAPLRGRSEAAARALSLLEVDVGFEQRAKHGMGYRVHTHMLRLRWKEQPVKKAIRKLDDAEMRGKAKAARKYLRSAEDCAYQEFAGGIPRRGQGLAKATSMTFTQERATDPRRQRAETLEDALRPARPESEEEGEEDAGGLMRHSIKRLYAALALGQLLGYTEHYEILQFVYDLHLWTDLGSKCNLGTGVPMRLMMAGSTFSPIYWRRVQSGLVDLVRQLGFPKLFFTLAPSEWTLPCHAFVLDGMTKLLRARLRLPVEETLHVTHTLLQTAKGFLLGHTGARQEWKDHLLAVRDETGRSRKLHGFVRIEFQDGTRRLATQEYHGSGRPHLHLLVFGDDDLVRTLDMPHLASATMPADEDLAGYVRGDAVFGSDRGLETTPDKAVGLRAYFPDILDALKCHQEWLNDDADATSIATTVLSRYHPLEPEMILQLFGARFRQWHFTTVSGGKRDFVVPVPDADDLPENHEVPAQLRYLTMAFLNGYGRDPEEVDRELKVEGHGRAAAQSIKDMLARALIEDYLSGKILAADTPSPTAGQAAGRAAAGRAATYNSQQTKFKALLDAAVSQAVRGRSEDAAAEEAAASARADPNFEALLRKLRTAKPDAATLKLLQKRKAWTPPGRPTPAGVQRLLHAHPDTTIVSCTRRGAQEVNECALRALFDRRPAIAPNLPGDLETNPANYDVEGKLLPDDVLQPLGVPIYKGMDIYLTKNIRKDVDFVNGMLVQDLVFDADTRAVLATRGLRVKTRTGHLIEVWRWSDPDHSGAELDRISVYLDVPKVPGAAYTAISRVRTGRDFLIGGSVADVHFTPAL
ncbi:unnamed protein product, partial [Effrenium voratum]